MLIDRVQIQFGQAQATGLHPVAVAAHAVLIDERLLTSGRDSASSDETMAALEGRRHLAETPGDRVDHEGKRGRTFGART